MFIKGNCSHLIIERNADVLLNVCEDIGLAGKTKYMEVARHRGIMANEHR